MSAPRRERHAHWDEASYAKGDRCLAPWAPLQLHTWSLQSGRQCEHCKLLKPLTSVESSDEMPDNHPMSLDWSSLIFGSYSIEEILPAVSDVEWQAIRVSMLGTSLDTKFRTLSAYIREATDDIDLRKIRCTNYINALKRGGLIPA